MRKTYVQDPETGRFVEKAVRAKNHGANIHSGFVPVHCPRTGELIRSAKHMSELAQHTGLSNSLDSLHAQAAKERRRRDMKSTPVSKAEIRDAYERASSSGFHRREQYE